MKVKQRPEDFQVEELTDLAPGNQGDFALYRLEKRGWSTPDAIALVRRRWKIEPRRISYGGLKDRHACTVQYLTIFHGPRRGLKQADITVQHLGQVAREYTSQDIRANRFRLTLRAMTAGAIGKAQQALEEVRAQGVPNYFDDQRFGSVSPDGEFFAKLMVLGRFEEALRLALTAPYDFDRAEQKKEKALLRSGWGDWAGLKERLLKGEARRLIEYLHRRPTDFRGALIQLRPELRSLYLSAYQSHLWNRMLARWLRQHCWTEQLIPVLLRLGEVPMHRGLTPELIPLLRDLKLPLPSARLQMDSTDPRMILAQEILAEEGLELPAMKVKGVREMFFSRGERAALCVPAGLDHRADADELHAGHSKLMLTFELPRGCYATILVKRITIV